LVVNYHCHFHHRSDDSASFEPKFRHTSHQIEAILDAVLSGERSILEPNIELFVEYMKCEGLEFYNSLCEGIDEEENNISEKFHMVLKMSV
jgi:hypothetical protein